MVKKVGDVRLVVKMAIVVEGKDIQVEVQPDGTEIVQS